MSPQGSRELLSSSTTALALPTGQEMRFQAPGPLFQCWSKVVPRIRGAQHILLLLDFDGTLTPLRDRPEDVQLGNATRRVLRRLVSHDRMTVAVVSGRRRADLRKRLGIRGVRYFGLHGWEDREGMSLLSHSQWLLLSARLWLAHSLRLSGIRMENKKMSLAMHFRKAPASAARELRRRIQDMLEMLEPEGLHVIEGSKVLEVLPPEIRGKGAAIRNILSRFPGSVFPIYIGDDASDESAFAALPDGITVRVGRARGSAARYTLRDPNEVHRFLERLESELC